MKGLVFAGCSFTWGEGLEIYSDLNTINWNSIKNFTYRFDNFGYFMPKSHKRYIESNRFSRIVSNYFETFDLVDDKNGGNHFTMLSHIKKCLIDYKDDIEYIIVQPTELARGIKLHKNCYKKCCEVDLIRMIESYYSFQLKKDNFSDYFDIVNENLKDKNNIEDYLNKRQYSEYNNFVKELIKIKKETGVEIKFLRSWNLETENKTTYSNIEKECSDFIIDNYIPIIYKNSKYKSFLELLKNNSELIIKSDFSFTENYHPNKKCHKIISDSIIQYLK